MPISFWAWLQRHISMTAGVSLSERHGARFLSCKRVVAVNRRKTLVSTRYSEKRSLEKNLFLSILSCSLKGWPTGVCRRYRSARHTTSTRSLFISNSLIRENAEAIRLMDRNPRRPMARSGPSIHRTRRVYRERRGRMASRLFGIRRQTLFLYAHHRFADSPGPRCAATVICRSGSSRPVYAFQ